MNDNDRKNRVLTEGGDEIEYEYFKRRTLKSWIWGSCYL